MSGKKQTTILIVDDDKAIADAVAFYLKGEGYDTVMAYDGIEALNAMKSCDISLIIMDIMMPGLDGIQTTLRIREEHNIPIIMLRDPNISPSKKIIIKNCNLFIPRLSSPMINVQIPITTVDIIEMENTVINLDIKYSRVLALVRLILV